MPLDPLTYAAPAIQLHTAAALVAIIATFLIFTRARGTRAHRLLGWVWIGAMALVAITSFQIRGSGPLFGLSWIHMLSVFVLAGIVLALRHIRRGDVAGHRGWMVGMVWGGLVVAGLFTLLPGRVMHAVILGG